ncbi:MerR family transcriptional regulator [Clostridiaceae bacterium HSG29]|nr:MerR family transcriptional regulator [Clostridiaceae bacterium HSG29]
MRNLLTIGELANILNINASTIRYYEQKGLIEPSKIDENNYRLYDFDKLDKMENILLLRDLDIPLKDLKGLLENYSLEKYIEILKTSRNNIEMKILDLSNKKNEINKKLESAIRIPNIKSEFKIKNYNTRNLSMLFSKQLNILAIKAIYEIIQNNPWFNYSQVNTSYIILKDNNYFEHCIENSIFPESIQLCKQVILNKGKYITYNFSIDLEENLNEDIITAENRIIEEATKIFNNYISEKKLYTKGPIIYKQIVKASTYKLYTFYITIEKLLSN